MPDREYVLITASDEEVPDGLQQALSAVVDVRRCPGPSAVDCPVMHDRRCKLRDEAKAVVVYLSGEHEFHSPGRWGCVTAGTAPVAVVGPGLTTRFSPGFALVGSDTGASGVLIAIAGMFDPPTQDIDRSPS